MSASWQVHKFGGAAVKDAAHIRNVASIIHSLNGDKKVIVISAMGKTTNAIEVIIDKFTSKQEYSTEVTALKEFHTEILQDLFSIEHEVFSHVDSLMNQLLQYVELTPADSKPFDYHYDQLIAFGELLSTTIVSAYLNHQGITNQWIDARKNIITDNNYREARINWDATLENTQNTTQQYPFILTQGFIGGTVDGITTTLGREGSDFTAAIWGYCLNAETVSIWKDVPGVLNADPRKFSDTIKMDNLSYRDAIEMTYYGAQVIHPRTIKPLQNKEIPLHVKCYNAPEGMGTIISAITGETALPSILVRKNNQVLLHLSTKDFSFIAEDGLSYIYKCFAECRIKINMVQNSAISLSLVFDDHQAKRKKLQELLAPFQIESETADLTLYTIMHFTEEKLKGIKADKEVLLEEVIRTTAQVLLKM